MSSSSQGSQGKQSNPPKDSGSPSVKHIIKKYKPIQKSFSTPASKSAPTAHDQRKAREQSSSTRAGSPVNKDHLKFDPSGLKRIAEKFGPKEKSVSSGPLLTPECFLPSDSEDEKPKYYEDTLPGSTFATFNPSSPKSPIQPEPVVSRPPRSVRLGFKEIVAEKRGLLAALALKNAQTLAQRQEAEKQKVKDERNEQILAALREEEKHRVQGGDLGMEIIECMRHEVMAQMRRHYQDEIRQQVYAEEAKWRKVHFDDLRAEVIKELQSSLAPMVTAKLQLKKLDQVVYTLKQELKPEVIQNLKVEFEDEVKMELRAKHEAGVKADIRAELTAHVCQQIREENTENIRSDLRLELQSQVTEQLRHEPIPPQAMETSQEVANKIKPFSEDVKVEGNFSDSAIEPALTKDHSSDSESVSSAIEPALTKEVSNATEPVLINDDSSDSESVSSAIEPALTKEVFNATKPALTKDHSSDSEDISNPIKPALTKDYSSDSESISDAEDSSNDNIMPLNTAVKRSRSVSDDESEEENDRAEKRFRQEGYEVDGDVGFDEAPGLDEYGSGYESGSEIGSDQVKFEDSEEEFGSGFSHQPIHYPALPTVQNLISYTNTKDTPIELDDSDEEEPVEEKAFEEESTLIEDCGFVAINKKA